MTIVSDIVKQMPAVRQPQRKFLAVLFATILALRGRVTLRTYDGKVNFPDLRRFD